MLTSQSFPIGVITLLAAFATTAPINAQDPTFTAGPDVVSLEDVGNFTATAWAQDVDLQGGTNAFFDVLVGDPSLFGLSPSNLNMSFVYLKILVIPAFRIPG